MKTLNAIFSIAAIALCCSTAAYAEQNASAKFTAVAPSGYEELVITARRGMAQKTMVFFGLDRSALSASIKTENRQAIQLAVQQSLTKTLAHPAQTVLQGGRHVTLQASL